MDKTVLVVRDLANAAEILAALDRANLDIRVAVWAYLDEYPDWWLILASPRFDEGEIGDALGQVSDALKAAGIAYEKEPPIKILKMSDKTIRDMRKMYSKSKELEGRNIGYQSFGNRFIEEAIAYRIK
jgi:hypothetical protein